MKQIMRIASGILIFFWFVFLFLFIYLLLSNFMNDNTNKIIDNNYEWKTIVIPNQIIFSNDGDVIKIRINKTKLYISSLNSYNKNISKRITKSCYFKIKKG